MTAHPTGRLDRGVKRCPRQTGRMPVELNHTIVASRDPKATAEWWAELLDLDPPEHWGPFWQVSTDNGVNIDFDRAVRARHDQALALRVPDHGGRVRRHFGRIVERSSTTTPTRPAGVEARSTTTTAVGACTSPTRTGTGWRSSPAPTGAANGARRTAGPTSPEHRRERVPLLHP